MMAIVKTKARVPENTDKAVLLRGTIAASGHATATETPVASNTIATERGTVASAAGAARR
ncbi:hypothetical protein NIIDMKKI_50430 [Mycobacterium kansasii]|uniref:Uncharacterized protein n=1 Tax=Mycobacterium kansasii TaxID=1768 RepID=A0A7G1IG37_MYCKA|nr:hypothetical protein NIIDMKKI_50430 [Mycobacterium kansasii]